MHALRVFALRVRCTKVHHVMSTTAGAHAPDREQTRTKTAFGGKRQDKRRQKGNMEPNRARFATNWTSIGAKRAPLAPLGEQMGTISELLALLYRTWCLYGTLF